MASGVAAFVGLQSDALRGRDRLRLHVNSERKTCDRRFGNWQCQKNGTTGKARRAKRFLRKESDVPVEKRDGEDVLIRLDEMQLVDKSVSVKKSHEKRFVSCGWKGRREFGCNDAFLLTFFSCGTYFSSLWFPCRPHPPAQKKTQQTFRKDELKSPESCPALVLNADYQPLSYMPLSIWPWQEVSYCLNMQGRSSHVLSVPGSRLRKNCDAIHLLGMRLGCKGSFP